ncbi:hypothetical protein SAMN05421743_12425 [Thalassobacillus cyri]|uniref:Pyridoxamine 5'-phosphate oxidase N-terminal domain-containing protein n=1 Tax=Thalassobacillus cyri TaxID=571932 RepID=A0A1H4H8Y5_9BACI|nr:pyridoxamine 5'-phosphate oxidase family protein [Thalassobacillus cyri]SEB18101.1 hypothetical protein SAMN05421743_12425 [Thalassobacillus cyri]
MDTIKKTIKTTEQLEALQGSPSKLAANKVINHIDPLCQHFISLSPFLVMSTSDHEGNCDSSPRGDAPGFAYILTKKYLLIPERPGNRRMDSLRNILENPSIGLLFIIPGLEETLRVNGKASLTTDPALLERLKSNGHMPALAIAVKVEACYIHCAKAFKRSHLWDATTWPDRELVPSPARMLSEHAKLPEINEDTVKRHLQESYTKRLY